ncbi:hypothetical protein [Streptomyces acidicola]|uniref:hypothetical protein n=1 Tax=Streptomyces acidicola TaxID=2596892 RepID=UPI0038189200
MKDNMSPLHMAAGVVAILCLIRALFGLPATWFYCFLAHAMALAAGAEAYRENKVGAVSLLSLATICALAAVRAAWRRRGGGLPEEVSTVGHGEGGDYGYRVDVDAFEAVFHPHGGNPLGAVGGVDAEVWLNDGSRWRTTFFTSTEAERLLDQWPGSNLRQGSGYFACSGGVIVKRTTLGTMVDAIAELLDSGDFAWVFQEIDEDVDEATYYKTVSPARVH